MGILSRFKDIMASNIHAIFNNEDKHPERTIEKYLNQLRTDLGQVKSETEALKTEYQRAQRAVDENLAEQEKLERYIQKSNDAGNSSDARTFERRLEKVKEDGMVLNQKFEQSKMNMDALVKMNDKLSGDISTLESKLNEIKSKMEAANAQQKMNQMAAKAGSGNPDEMFNKMNEKANYALDRANAMAELEKGPETQNYSDLESLAEKYDNIVPENIDVPDGFGDNIEDSIKDSIEDSIEDSNSGSGDGPIDII